MDKPDIYNIHRKLERALARIQKDKSISPANLAHILKFKDACLADGLTIHRVLRHLFFFQTLARLFKIDFAAAMRPDIQALVQQVEQSDYADATKQDLKAALKKFYRWLRQTEDYPDEVRWIKTGIKGSRKKLPEGLVTPQDVQKLMAVADHPRDRALVAVLYESGCRVGELASMRIKSVAFDEFGAVVTVFGKTGAIRKRLIISGPSLSEWLDIHPHKGDPNASVWTGIGPRCHNRPLGYGAFRGTLQRLFKKAGITKRFNPQQFRHARATHLSNKLTDAQLKGYFGWTQGSKMTATYIHLSGRDVDDALLQMHGLKQGSQERNPLEPVKCPRCQHINPSIADQCHKCGQILSIAKLVELDKQKSEAERLLFEFIKAPRVRQAIEEEAKERMKKPIPQS